MADATATSTARTPAGRRYGGQSMSARLRSVLVRRPAPPAGDEDWRAFGYLHPVDPAAAEAEHAAFRDLLAAEGAEVVAAGDDPPGMLDAIFAYDPAIITDAGAILCRLGKEPRRDEAALAERAFAGLGIPILGRIAEPGTLEGGDAFWLDEATLAVGRGYRTNAEGIAQLAAIVAGIGVEVVPVGLPHWHGPDECLHLMSLISPVAADLAVAYPPLLETAFMGLLRDRGWRLVEVPDEEFAGMACNVLALAPGRCLMIEGNPVTRSRLEAEGCTVLTYRGDEISRNREGGPTCLTRPLWRGEA
jgi:N-dimethylarginine dimethylaminohydrolase